MNIYDILCRLNRRELSVAELVQDTVTRIRLQNDLYNAFITIDEERAIDEARKADDRLARKEAVGLLHGIPIGIKDIIDVAGMPTTMGSALYRDNIATGHATVVSRLCDAGAIVLGKLHTHEFAYGPTGDKSAFGPAKNPHDAARMTGGSSSGAGAAVALGWIAAGIGTDTGGSVRIPATLCGVVGLKPTYGLVPKSGVYPLSSSLDHVGPLTTTVKDAALLLSVMAGHDAADPCSVERALVDYTRSLEGGVRGMRIGIPTAHFWDPIEPNVRNLVQASIRQLEHAGASIVGIDLPDMQDFIRTQQAIQRSEAYAVHARHMETHPDKLGDEIRERLLMSANTKGYEYVLAKAEQRRAQQSIESLFDSVDCLAAPTVPIFAPELGEREMTVDGYHVDSRTMLLKNTQPFNLTGHPALSIPCGADERGLPAAIQLVGPLFGEEKLLQIGAALESIR